MLPDGGLIGFVVDWTASRRRNYDTPDDPSPGAFWEAVAQVIAGTRRPIHTTDASLEVEGTEPTAAHHAAAAIAELDRSTWLAGVGQPLPLGFPERFANARMVASWGEAKPRSPNPPRSCSGAPRWRVSGWLAGDGADRTSGRNTKGQPQEGGSSPSGYFRAGAAIAAIRPSPLNSESYLAREVFVPLILRGEGLPGHGELAEVEFS